MAKKAKIMLTEKEQAFASLFQPAESKIDKPREIDLRRVSGRDVSLKQQGARKHDVSYVYTIVDPTYVYTIVAPDIDYWKETIKDL